MHYSFRRYLRHFLLRYYLSGGLLATPEQVGVFFLSSRSCSVLLTRRRRVVAFEENIGDLPDAPPVPSKSDPGTAGVRSLRLSCWLETDYEARRSSSCYRTAP